MDLGISTNPTPELYTIKVAGEIDISNADSLRNAIDLALEQPTEAVELDFAQVSYIDSTGIGVLVGAAHHAVDHGKRFSCTNVQPPVMRVVQLKRLPWSTAWCAAPTSTPMPVESTTESWEPMLP